MSIRTTDLPAASVAGGALQRPQHAARTGVGLVQPRRHEDLGSYPIVTLQYSSTALEFLYQISDHIQ